MFECKYLNYKKSLIAVSCLYLACKINKKNTDKILAVIPVNIDRVKEVSKMLLRTFISNQEKQYEATNKKFGTEYFFEVSKIKFELPKIQL